MQPRSSTSSNKRPRSTGCLKRSGTKNTTPPAFFCVVVVVSGGVGVVVVTRSAYATIIVLSEISWGQKLASSLYADRCTYTLRRFDVTGFDTHTRARTHARSHARTYTHTHSLTRTRTHARTHTHAHTYIDLHARLQQLQVATIQARQTGAWAQLDLRQTLRAGRTATLPASSLMHGQVRR